MKLNRLTLILSFCFGSAFADQVIYVEPFIGSTSYSTAEVNNFSLSKNDTNKGIFVGYQFADQWAAEVGYLDAGKLSYTTATAGSATFFNGRIRSSGTWAGGLDASIKGYTVGVNFTPYKQGLWDVGLRAGAYRAEGTLDMSATASGATYTGGVSKTITKPYYGVGIGYRVNDSTRIALNWLTFNASDYDLKANMYNVSLRFDF